MLAVLFVSLDIGTILGARLVQAGEMVPLKGRFVGSGPQLIINKINLGFGEICPSSGPIRTTEDCRHFLLVAVSLAVVALFAGAAGPASAEIIEYELHNHPDSAENSQP